jgi:hypothetical protein
MPQIFADWTCPNVFIIGHRYARRGELTLDQNASVQLCRLQVGESPSPTGPEVTET